MSLGVKQEMFVEHYLVCFNATEAYQRAYNCTRRAASSNGYKLLKNPEIREAIDAKTTEVLAELGVNRRSVLTEIARCGFSNLLDLATVDPKRGVLLKDPASIDRALYAAVESVKTTVDTIGTGDDAPIVRTRVEIKLHSKERALEMLAQNLQLLKPAAMEVEATVEHHHYVAEVPGVTSIDEWRKRYAKDKHTAPSPAVAKTNGRAGKAKKRAS